mmetsp:Transcript_45765/g.46260  ORF Transcript_45765/g.46260 Transcript_45765/m.46260 type:complete len:92 (-) Transcript_45765:12-287(-)
MSFTRFVEVGRICLVNYGPEEGKLATIIEIVDQNKCVIEGPAEVTGVERQMIPYSRIHLTDFKVDLYRNAKTKDIKKAWKEGDILAKWEKK